MRIGKKQEPDKRVLYNKTVIRPKQEFYGKVPNLLIGEYGYPHVNVGSLIAEDYSDQDDAKGFAKSNLKINDILYKRQALINTRQTMFVKERQTRYGRQVEELAKSTKATSSEVHTEKPVSLQMGFHERAAPHGPSVLLKKLDITENTKIPKRVDQLTEDNTKASAALSELQEHKFDEYYLTKLLSVGSLGHAKNKKIVPTKWSITAVDDTLGKNVHEDIFDYAEHDLTVITGNYLGNYYHILIQPGTWSFELIEYVMPKTIHNDSTGGLLCHDYEFSQGRKKYADNTAGGYYATRLPILEYFKKIHKQGRVTVYRIITPEYNVPLGVWVVREGVRKSMRTSMHKEQDEAKGFVTLHPPSLREAKKELLDMFKAKGLTNAQEYLDIAKLLKEQQTGLGSWF